MPIRFRCYYCDQLMGIARRKAGTVVICPKCKGQVIVPNPEPGAPEEEAEKPVPQPGPAPGPALFEQSDLERILQQEPARPSPAQEPYPPAPAPPRQLPPVPDAMDVQELPVPMSPAPPKSGIFLSPGKLALIGVGVVLFLGAAFVLGLLLGRGMPVQPP